MKKKGKIAKSHRFMDLLKATLKMRILIQFFMLHVAGGWLMFDGGCHKRENKHIHINFICLICLVKCAFMPASISLQPNNQIYKSSARLGSAKRTLHHCGANRSHHYYQSAIGFYIQKSKK